MNKYLQEREEILSVIAFFVLGLSVDAQAASPQPPAPSAPDGIIGGHEYVDLGLPSGTLWATSNLGATSPYEAGDFYAWGEVKPRNYFTWDNYQYTLGILQNPNTGVSWYELEDIGNNICGTEYDAARHQWGNGWRLPNKEELYELRMLCWNKWTRENGVNGIRVYGPNEHSIFLPAGGQLFYNYPMSEDIWGYCWSGIANTEETDFDGTPIVPGNCAYAIQIDSGGLQNNDRNAKAGGNNVRPVINRKESGTGDIGEDTKGVMISYRNGCIYVTEFTAHSSIKVYDLSGQILFSGPVINGVCQLPALSNGIYILTYSFNGHEVITQKITV